MPFTFSHPAIILPLKQAKPRWFSLTGLVMGSMAPDFEYFFKLQAVSTVSETLAGIFTFNLPVTIVFAILFHELVRNPLIRHLPRPFDRRFSGFLKFDFLKYLKQHPLRFLISALTGILSHLLLDVLTSPDTMTRSFHRLQQSSTGNIIPALEAALGESSFLLMERTFSVASLLLFLYLLAQVNCPSRKFVKESQRQKIKFFLTFTAFFLAGISAILYFLAYGTSFGQLIIDSISAGMLSLLITSLLFRRDRRFRRET